MQAFIDCLVTRDDFLASMRAHREADRIVQGAYWTDGRGCAVGCGIQSVIGLTGRAMAHEDRAALAAAIGVPESLMHLQDTIHEGLPVGEARDWPVQFAEAIATGADLSDVARRFLVRMLREIVLPVAGDVSGVVRRVADGLDCQWSNGDTVAEAAQATAAAARADAYRAMRDILLDEMRSASVPEGE